MAVRDIQIRDRGRPHMPSPKGELTAPGSGAVSHRREDRAVAKDQQPPHRKNPCALSVDDRIQGCAGQEQEDVIYVGSRDISDVSVRDRKRRVHQFPRLQYSTPEQEVLARPRAEAKVEVR